MCEGLHVESTKEIPQNCFKLKALQELIGEVIQNNTMMTRIYAWAFETKEELTVVTSVLMKKQ